MKGFITKTLSAVCLTGGLMTAGGCGPHYNEVVDPCYPERYQHMARKEVEQAFGTQVQNGHILDQTVWNTYFEPGTSRLTAGGMDHLLALVRRRPCPDTTVYVQTAQDVVYDPGAPDRFVEARKALDSERAESVQKYLDAQAAGRNLTFQVALHDPADVDAPGIAANGSARVRVMAPAQGFLPQSVFGIGASANAPPPTPGSY